MNAVVLLLQHLPFFPLRRNSLYPFAPFCTRLESFSNMGALPLSFPRPSRPPLFPPLRRPESQFRIFLQNQALSSWYCLAPDRTKIYPDSFPSSDSWLKLPPSVQIPPLRSSPPLFVLPPPKREEGNHHASPLHFPLINTFLKGLPYSSSISSAQPQRCRFPQFLPPPTSLKRCHLYIHG